MDISGTTRVFMILGDPIDQVRAPALFNPLFRRHGVDAVLVPARVAPADVSAFALQVLRAGNIDGLWLTIPHKSAMLPVLDRFDHRARVAQAVNAVRRNADGSLEGALFDGEGFARSLDCFGVLVAGRRVLVVGAGGAGVAIAVSLAERSVAELALFDPDRERSATATGRIRAAWPEVPTRVAESADPAGYDLLINASPLGLRPDDPLPFDARRVRAGAVVVDILMKNQPTPLLQACEARGARVYPGFEMLNQQVPDYLDFFGLHEVASRVKAEVSEVGSPSRFRIESPAPVPLAAWP
jgi:shikimate dehydrogenase